MKTRNLHPRLFTLTFTSLLPLLALASTACGAAPGSQGDEPATSAPASAVEEGTDSGAIPAAPGEPEPSAPIEQGAQRSSPSHAGHELWPDRPPTR
jgi:hypothetical protein